MARKALRLAARTEKCTLPEGYPLAAMAPLAGLDADDIGLRPFCIISASLDPAPTTMAGWAPATGRSITGSTPT